MYFLLWQWKLTYSLTNKDQLILISDYYPYLQCNKAFTLRIHCFRNSPATSTVWSDWFLVSEPTWQYRPVTWREMSLWKVAMTSLRFISRLNRPHDSPNYGNTLDFHWGLRRVLWEFWDKHFQPSGGGTDSFENSRTKIWAKLWTDESIVCDPSNSTGHNFL